MTIYTIPHDTWSYRFNQDNDEWECSRTRFTVHYSTSDIINMASKEFNNLPAKYSLNDAWKDVCRWPGIPFIFRVPSSKYRYMLVARQYVNILHGNPS